MVVGAGNSALDVCLDLIEGGAQSVSMSVRTPAIKTGCIRIVGGVQALEPGQVVCGDGSREVADAVIAATGYEKQLEPLVGHLRALDECGSPLVCGGRTLPHAPGLYFIGFTNVLAGNLRQIRLDANAIARDAAR